MEYIKSTYPTNARRNGMNFIGITVEAPHDNRQTDRAGYNPNSSSSMNCIKYYKKKNGQIKNVKTKWDLLNFGIHTGYPWLPIVFRNACIISSINISVIIFMITSYI